MGWADFGLPARGEWFDNEDSASRQLELAKCWRDKALELVRVPYNPHDPHAVAIFKPRGIGIGYLCLCRALWIGAKIARQRHACNLAARPIPAEIVAVGVARDFA